MAIVLTALLLPSSADAQQLCGPESYDAVGTLTPGRPVTSTATWWGSTCGHAWTVHADTGSRLRLRLSGTDLLNLTLLDPNNEPVDPTTSSPGQLTALLASPGTYTVQASPAVGGTPIHYQLTAELDVAPPDSTGRATVLYAAAILILALALALALVATTPPSLVRCRAKSELVDVHEKCTGLAVPDRSGRTPQPAVGGSRTILENETPGEVRVMKTIREFAPATEQVLNPNSLRLGEGRG